MEEVEAEGIKKEKKETQRAKAVAMSKQIARYQRFFVTERTILLGIECIKAHNAPHKPASESQSRGTPEFAKASTGIDSGVVMISWSLFGGGSGVSDKPIR